MVYNTQNHWVYELCPSSAILLVNGKKTQRFGHWIYFRLQDEIETLTLLDL
jgi:hypothetical protein